MSSPPNRCAPALGQRAFINTNGLTAKATTPQYAPWPINGSAFYTCAGEHANLTTQSSTSVPCFSAVRPTPPRSITLLKKIDRPPQTSGETRSSPLISLRHFGLVRCGQEGGALGQGHNPGRVVFDRADDLPRLQCSFLLKSAPYAEIGNPTSRILVLFAQGLGVRFAVRIKEFLSALLPRRSQFGRCNVPVRPAFLGNGP